jgi:hypothetical protein
MQHLDEIVKHYLESDTNYAMLITGEWGVGKTYYFKHILESKISETPIYGDDSKKYTPLLISLFGLKSIEEIQTEILLSLYPILKNKKIKLGISIGKSLIKGILRLNQLGDIVDIVSDIEVDKGGWIKFNELVICFDDLERMSENLNIEEFIGYINSLVENDNIKVLIIANQTRITQANYYLLKEKVVGNTIEFIPDLRVSYDSLLEVKFVGSPEYKAFLIDNKNFVLNIFTHKSSNLRILSFALSYFQNVFSAIMMGLQSQDILKEKEGEILKTLLKFSLAISIEYKENRISFKNNKGIGVIEEPHSTRYFLEELELEEDKNIDIGEEKNYREKFIQQYYKEDKYHYFNSVYCFLTGGPILKPEDLIEELKVYYHIEENKILPQYEIFNRLSNASVFSLTDKEYKQLTKKVLEYSDRGNFDIKDYLTVFYFASRFENPLGLNLGKLEKRIIRGMLKGKAKYNFNSNLDFYLNIDSTSEHKEQLIRIRKAVLDLNNQIQVENLKLDSKRLEKLCFEDFYQFNLEILNNENSYALTPIFESFSSYKFYLFFIQNENNIRWQIIQFIRNRYHNQNLYLKPEMVFFKKLNERVTKKILNHSQKGVSYFLLNEFDKALKASIKNLTTID